MDIKNLIAHNLLKINAIKINPANPFTWASGLKAPIYCDNRKSLFHHEIRTIIRDAYVDVVREHFPEVEVIAGVATGAIAQGVLVADKMSLPFIYVREKPKEHGLKKIIEGDSPKGKKVVVIEDLISTGGSSLKVVNELRREDADVLGMAAIFTYEFDTAIKNFEENGCQLVTLSNFTALIEQAVEDGLIQKSDLSVLWKWHDAPDKFFV
ncbi:MAG: orotate phosphoribosyltransferase [Prevotellaceae bacterium]|jgi:orotate phosphoribosyltransferase|nr:orotate phosphoribosyltransferase [Prevotellaceae bacterium]